jgi:hypothetical protein
VHAFEQLLVAGSRNGDGSLSFTGTRLSAKLSMANLRALDISSSARRRVFSASALARRKASDISACLACSAANCVCRSASGGALAWPSALVSGVWNAGSWVEMGGYGLMQPTTLGRKPQFQEGYSRNPLRIRSHEPP